MAPERATASVQIRRGRGWITRALFQLVLMGLNVVPGTSFAESLTGARPASSAAHWAFQPPQWPTVPVVQNPAWPRTDLDRFVLAQLESQRLAPVRFADRTTLLRRVTFDLTGLPPTPEELEAFLADARPDAWDRVIERLLASPRYGERWGRHWMDVVRYADTAGDNADYPIPEIHLYRDYLIDAFNADKPFDRLLTEQLAGDILADRGESPYADGIIATGFLALSRRYGTGPYELWHLTLENTLETVGQAFLGLNLKCARCHDHKFDPVTMADYYGLYGIFAGTEFPWAGSEEVQSKNFNRQKFVPLVPPAEAAPKFAAWNARLAELRAQISALESTNVPSESRPPDAKQRLAELKTQLRTMEKPGAPPDLPMAYAVREGQAKDVPLQKRGEPATPGDVVPRCVPAFLAGPGTPSFPSDGSGRLELARWLVDPRNPLTARVFVNRVWLHHFGAGLVPTPNNLGQRSEPPIHQDLLDYLARSFVQSGWSVKALHRLILRSATYQLASENSVEGLQRDPANRLHWHFARQRLEAESIRDAMLFAAGTLNLARPGPQPFPGPDRWTWTQHTPFKEQYETDHRSVYLMTQRFQRHPFLALFDGPDTNNSTESRRASIVPQQALYAMNHPWVDAQATALAARVMREADTTERRLDRLALLTWSRALAVDETPRWLGWWEEARALGGDSAAWTVLARVALNASEFLYVD